MDARGCTPLHDACDGDGNPGQSRQRLQNRAGRSRRISYDDGQSASSRENVARLLINAGADPGARITTAPSQQGRQRDERGGGGRRAGKGTAESERWAISTTATIGDGNRGRQDGGEGTDVGMTPLHLACRFGRRELACYLIRVGASVSVLVGDDGGVEWGCDPLKRLFFFLLLGWEGEERGLRSACAERGPSLLLVWWVGC